LFSPFASKRLAPGVDQTFLAAPTAEDLLAGVARQDRDAFAQLFRLYAPKLKAQLVAKGALRPAADELVQEVFLAIWRKAAQFDATRGSAAAWIFALGRNAFIDRIRRESRPEVDPNDPLFVPAAEPVQADRLMAAEQERSALLGALAELPQEQRDVMHRAYFAGRSLAEIATETRLPLGTVKTRARLALARLRARLGAGDEAQEES